MFLLHPTTPPWQQAGPAGLQLVLLVDAELQPGQVLLRGLPDNEEQLTAMQPDGRDGSLWRWRAQLAWDGGSTATRYAFVVATPQGHHWLAADGLHRHTPPEAQHFRVHPTEAPPDWVRDQVFYQVFPDRFRRGREPQDRAGELLHGGERLPVLQPAWGTPPDPRHAVNSFYGGDLPGVQQALPYLQDELGVSAIYLNPVFASPSNHRYDTTDYYNVDPHLGGNAALAELRQATAARGMRLVLDAVVNHTSADHPWFDRWGRHGGDGAAGSPASPWRSHYAFNDQGYAIGWKGHDSLPVLDFATPAVQQAIYGAADAVLRHWLRPPHAIDGWRLDVIHMLGEGPGAHNNAHHVRAMRRAIRDTHPQAYVLGEHFAEATRWLQGDQEDGAMNYHGLASPVRAWLAGQVLAGHRARLPTADFEAWMTRAIADIPYANQLAQLNLLDSHDTPRLLTELDGDVALMQLAVTLLFTRPGVPCIYYGDEIGLQGGPDPDCRRCFDWDRSHWNTALWQHYRRLAALRRTREDWCRGATLTLGLGADWLAYARYTAGLATVVVVNRGAAAQATLPLHRLPLRGLRWRDIDGASMTPDDAGVLRLPVAARSQRLLLGQADTR